MIMVSIKQIIGVSNRCVSFQPWFKCNIFRKVDRNSLMSATTRIGRYSFLQGVFDFCKPDIFFVRFYIGPRYKHSKRINKNVKLPNKQTNKSLKIVLRTLYERINLGFAFDSRVNIKKLNPC